MSFGLHFSLRPDDIKRLNLFEFHRYASAIDALDKSRQKRGR